MKTIILTRGGSGPTMQEAVEAAIELAKADVGQMREEPRGFQPAIQSSTKAVSDDFDVQSVAVIAREENPMLPLAGKRTYEAVAVVKFRTVT